MNKINSTKINQTDDDINQVGLPEWASDKRKRPLLPQHRSGFVVTGLVVIGIGVVLATHKQATVEKSHQSQESGLNGAPVNPVNRQANMADNTAKDGSIGLDKKTININDAKSSLESILAEISNQEKIIEKKDDELNNLSVQHKESLLAQDALKQSLGQKEAELSATLMSVEALSHQLEDKDEKISSLGESIAVLEAKESDVRNIKEENALLSNENDGLRRDNGQLNIKVADLRRTLSAQKLSLQPKEPEDVVPPHQVSKEDVINVADAHAKSAKPSPTLTKRSEQSSKTEQLSKADKPAAGKKSKLQGLHVIGATADAIVAIKDGKPITIAIGTAWNGVSFDSVDVAKGTISTSDGEIKY